MFLLCCVACCTRASSCCSPVFVALSYLRSCIVLAILLSRVTRLFTWPLLLPVHRSAAEKAAMSTARFSQRIAIIGVGPSGLMAAHSLARAGFKRVSMFDAAPSFAKASPALQRGGTILAANGVRILDRMGLLAPIYPRANPINNVAAFSHANHKLSAYSPSALVGAKAKSMLPDSVPITSMAMPGKLLFNTLTKTLPKEVQVHFGSGLQDIRPKSSSSNNGNGNSQEEAGGPPLELRIGPGGVESFEADLVLADDGVHSRARSCMEDFASHQPKPLEGMYVRGLVSRAIYESTPTTSTTGDFSRPPPLRRTDELVEIWGRAGSKFSYAWIDSETIWWMATLGRKASAGLVEGAPTLGVQLGNILKAFPEPVGHLVDATAVAAEQPVGPFGFDLCPIEELSPGARLHSTDGRMALMGSAGHHATQDSFQNLAQQFEDAVVLSSLLTKFDRLEALKRYSALRVPRAQFVVSAAHSETLQTIEGGRVMSAFRDMASSLIPPAIQRENQAQILAYDAFKEAEKEI